MSLDREIGELTAKVENLEKAVEKITQNTDQMRVFMEQARGSYKTVMGIAGASAAIGALVSKFVAVWPVK